MPPAPARAVCAFVAALALFPAAGAAQTWRADGGGALALAGAPLQDDLEALARRLAAAWSRGNLEALAAVMAPDGLALHLGGSVHPALGVRQARAALQDFLKDTGEGTARPLRSEILGGEQPRGLVELGWTPAAGSLPAPAGYSVFIGLQRRSEGWRATEIRIIR